MIAYRLIQRKRDGGALTPSEVRELFTAYGRAEVAEYQMAALLMAVFFRGLNEEELAALVAVMLDSGARVDFSAVPGRRVDKHSTGGVGDKVSLVLAPLVASLGVQVPMMSGRGLGHTGGTLDKLEAIPGFRTDLSVRAFRDQVARLGVAMIGQTGEIAPLDRRLYALRDVTATVECIPLIASSIMSKKLAEGIDGLVLDVKTGGGAFVPERERGVELARTMIGIGASYDVPVVALLTAMDRPLGRAVGNALETREAIETLRGGGPADVREVTLALAAEMLVLGGAAATTEAARRAAAERLDDGGALAMMRRLIEAQHGDPRVLDEPGRLPAAAVQRVVEAEADSWVHAVAARALGEAAVELGAGRRTVDDELDPSVGYELDVRPGQHVRAGEPLGTVHAASAADAERGAAALRAALRLGPEPPSSPPPPLIQARIAADGAADPAAAEPRAGR